MSFSTTGFIPSIVCYYCTMTTLDIAIPAHNEAAIIVPTLKLVTLALEKIPHLNWRVIVVDNASTDGTAQVVRNANIPHVEVVTTTKRGKGAALKVAAAYSDATYFGFIDADASPDPKAFAVMLDHAQKHKAPIVIGSRFHRYSTSDRNFLRHNSSRIFNFCARLIVGIRVNDTQCPMKLMDTRGKKLLQTCTDDTWFLDLELIARAEEAKLTLLVLPVIWKEFRYPNRKSKLRLGIDAIAALQTMWTMRRKLKKGQ